MKKLITAFIILLIISAPLFAHAEDIPELTDIAFSGAKVNEAFYSENHEYTLTLDNPAVTPTLKSYRMNGSAKLFVNYNLDSAKHQTGITVTLEFDDGSSAYTFNYANANYDTHSENNYLKDISCGLCRVYPKVSPKLTRYRLYIPSDLTVLKIAAVTEDVNAYCDLPKNISLAPDQEPELSLTVTAANGKTRPYRLKIKRLSKTSAEIEREIENGSYNSVLRNEMIYKNPVFIVSVCAVSGGAAAVLALIVILRRVTVKAEDEDETEFFDN